MTVRELFLAIVFLAAFVGPPIARNWDTIWWRGRRRLISPEYFRIRADQVEAIAAIDDAPLLRRLQRDEGMDPVAAALAVSEYKAFLAIAGATPDRMVAPTSAACDAAWHAHILDTETYDRDMRAIFGRPFHHRPADGAEEPWLKQPQLRTEGLLGSFEHISNWSGLRAARALRKIPEEMELSVAAILGLAVASGPDGLETVVSTYLKLGGPKPRSYYDAGCGGGSCGGDASGHSGGHSCGGHSCGGSSCGGGSCGGH